MHTAKFILEVSMNFVTWLNVQEIWTVENRAHYVE